MKNKPCPKVLGIDEHFFPRKRGYATALVDLKRNEVFHGALGRSEASLKRYLKALPGRDNPTYCHGFVRNLPRNYPTVLPPTQ